MYAEVGCFVCFGACVMCRRRSLFNVFPPESLLVDTALDKCWFSRWRGAPGEKVKPDKK